MNQEQFYEESIRQYAARTPKSKEAYALAREYLAGGETRSIAYHRPYPLTVRRAEGCRLYDVDGNEYVDFLGNYTSLIHGHAHPEITKRIVEAVSVGTACPAGIEDQVELGRILCERVPGIERIRFCNSGTEATMFAVRAARAFKRRDGIIKMEGGYHGTADFAEFSIAPPVDPKVKRTVFEPVPESFGIPVNAGRDLFIAPFNDLDEVENILKKHHPEIAGIIVEPVLGALGVIPPAPGYLEGLRRLADTYDVLLIFDEVQTLRVHYGGAQSKYGVTPDLTAVAKIIGGGLPVGGIGGKAEVMSVFDPLKKEHLSQSGTFNGNRATMAAGIASMELLDRGAIDRLERLSERLEAGMVKAIADNAIPATVTRVGSLLNLHFTAEKPHDYQSVLNPHFDKLPLYHLEMLRRGYFLAVRGTWALSTVMSEKEIDGAVAAFGEVMEEMRPLF
ncbi:aspartate aminotransferase family protein [Papillibacter cinnamivorans]|uniref:Glutamate-1-semialdehyde 2,1-aminomutase n=1 Tax=Papillibacter cinnamivorans DSM 12816 TaxID=1122930 RepID=A0A1W2AUK0_9FIRM|nr:aspartate aminotransferase family protein [Papillibacter cinnamivorans]SMC63878.1 glutamate-1-semialdehyde 2,1-aminomutase [Papillibacter cinnamivorans DSM 12816]